MGKQWTREQWELKVIEMLQEEPTSRAKSARAIVGTSPRTLSRVG
jgi:hypothetical protein